MKTILFIDDEAYINEPLKEALGFDYNVIFISSILEAKKKFIEKINEIDLVLLDVMMGIKDEEKQEDNDILKKTDSGYSAGIYLYNEFKSILSKKNKETPIIIFTARFNILNDFKDLDETKVLIKPVNFEKLLIKIKDNLPDE